MNKDEAYYLAVELIEKLIGIPSPSRDEAGRADLIEKILRTHGAVACRKGNNIWTLHAFHSEAPWLLLNSHIDTVRPVAGWTKDPFQATRENDRIYGLGSNDAGASLVSLLSVFLLLKEKKQPYNLAFLASAEEEISGKYGLESALPELPPVAFAVVGEPTGMQPAIAEKGLMVLDCTVTGISGHAARDEGENAIYKALEIIDRIRKFRFEKISPLLGEVKMTVTQIQAGTQHNVIPDRCTFVTDVRSNELYTNREILDTLQQEIPCLIQPRSLRLNSSRTDPAHPFVQRTELLGCTPFGSPTLSDQALMPFPSVKIGPGDSARSHTADEYIRIEEIREAIEIYLNLLDGLSLRD